MIPYTFLNKLFNKFKRFEFLLVSLLFLILSVIFWYKTIFFNKSLFFDLTTRYFYPIFSFLAQSIKSKQLPLWNPFIYSGTPFLANPQSGVFYPLNYIFIFLNFPDALTFYIYIHTVLAGIFMYLLARDVGLKCLPSICSTVLFMFNGFFVLHCEFVSNISAYVWIPLIFLLFRKSILTFNIKYCCLTAIFIALQFFAGYPQFVFYTFCLLFIYMLGKWVCSQRQIVGLLKLLFIFTIISTLFLLLSMAQILPFIEFFKHSVRSSGINFDAVTAYSLHPITFIKLLFIPVWNNFISLVDTDVHIVGFYFGIFSVLLSILFLLKHKTRVELFLFIVFGFSVLLSFGKFLPIYNMFYAVIPGWKYFRFPSQILYLTAFAFSLITGYSIEKIGSYKLQYLLCFLFFIDLFIFGLNANPLLDKKYYNLKTDNISFLCSDNSMFRFMLTPKTRAQLPSGKNYYDIWQNYKNTLYPNIGVVYNLFDIDGQDPLRLQRYENVLYQVAYNGPSTNLIDMLNCKYIISFWNLGDKKYKLVNSEYPMIFKNIRYFPRLWFVDKSKYLQSDKVLDYISKNTFRPQEEVVIEDNVEHKSESMSKTKNYIEIVNYSFNEINVKVNSNKNQWLVLSETYYPGWYAKIDDKLVKSYCANYILRAVYVPSGEHKIRFFYKPKSVIIGCFISIVSFIIILILLFVKPIRQSIK